jgi:putative endopeptidase
MLRGTGFLFGCYLLAISSLSALADTVKEQNKDSLPPPLVRFSLGNLDRTADACVDFYQYACGGLNAKHPIPPDRQYWDPTGERIDSILHNALEKAAVNDSKRSYEEQLIGSYYSACIDEQGPETQGISALRPELDRIRAIRDRSAIAKELAHLHKILYLLAEGSNAPTIFGPGSLQPIFGFYSWQDFNDSAAVVAFVDQGGLGLGNLSYYLNQDAESITLRKQYLKHIRIILALAGDTDARQESGQILKLETALAASWMDDVARQDRKNLENRFTRDQLQLLVPSFAWGDYFREIGAPSSPYYVVTVPQFFRNLENLLRSTSLEDWKSYLRWRLLDHSSAMLNKRFGEEKFRFLALASGRQQHSPRWKECVWATDRDLSHAVGPVYVSATFPAGDRDRIQEIAIAVEKELEKDIDAATWMSPATQREAIAKLHRVVNRIGYAERWKDYAGLSITRNSWLTNSFRASEFELEFQLNEIGKPVDRAEWRETAETLDLYYTRQQNVITVPAAFLQPPTFDRRADDALNFGGIGYYLGHELVHGFDSTGRKFDQSGTLRDWWTPEDARQFDEKAKCISDQYSEYAMGGVKLNGARTLAENIADAGGLRLALMAFEARHQAAAKIDEFTPEQRFFLSFGLQYCGSATPEYERSVALADLHANAKFRVNGVVSNMPEFRRAFGCKKGQPMVRENACRVW